MLIKKSYSVSDVLLWTRFEIILFLTYAMFVTFLYKEIDMTFLHVPWTPLALIGTAVAFLIGFQNNAAYGRIWEARKIWGGIVNTSRSFAMKSFDMIRPIEGKASREEVKELHRTLVFRHIAWLTALRYAMRDSKPWETGSAHKTGKEWNEKICIPEHQETLQKQLTNYLPLSELDYVMSKGNIASTILFMQSKHLRKLKEEGVLWEFAFLNLEDVLQEMFTLQGKSERIKNFPYPRQYSTISCLFIWMFLLLLPFGIVPEFAEIGAKFSNTFPGFVWLAIPFSAAVSWVFHTMERIGRAGENPFEGTPNDVPISTIARAIEIDLRQQLNEASSQIPQPFPEDHHVQM